MSHSPEEQGGKKYDTRERAIAEAQRMLLRGGYAAMSLEAIAQEIGIRTPSLYHHFPGGKDELFLAVVEHGSAEDGKWILQVMAEHEDPVEKLRAAARYFFTLAGQHPYHAITERRKQLPPEVRERIQNRFAERVEAPLLEVITKAVAAGQFRAVDPVIAVRAFLMLMVSHGEFEADDRTRAQLPDALVDLFAEGVRVHQKT